MDASEVIRETRLSMFEGEWGSGPDDCVLAHAAKVIGEESWAAVHRARPDVVSALSKAVVASGGETFGLAPCSFADAVVVYTHNDTFGRTFDEIVEVTEIAEKFAEINKENEVAQ